VRSVRIRVDLATSSKRRCGCPNGGASDLHGSSGPTSAPTTRESNLIRLLDFARVLQDVTSFGALLDASRAEVHAATGYAHAWLLMRDERNTTQLRLLETSSDRRDDIWHYASVLDVKGDPFLEELLSSHVPLVIPDARIDPRTNKLMVDKLQNRTLINIPLLLLESPFGVFGVGTFGEEGCRPPSPEELNYLVGMASQISVAASRIRWQEAKAQADRERGALERRLAQVQKLESLGLLAGGIAHDFNNLLTVIIASASMANELSDDDAIQSEVKQVLEAAERAAALTRQLLAMSRAQGLSLRPLDVNELLRQLLAMLRRILPENVAVDLIEGRALPLVEGDRSQLDQVFMNLLINARDAMPDGGKVTIETEQVLVNGHYAETHPWAKPGRYVLITVTDTGTGMAREVLERIFEPFFTTKGSKAGTGLGLAVSYGIIRQHEGMLHCYSELGVGTSFKVYLPAAQRLAATVGTKLQAAPSRGIGRVLVAEDDDAVRAVVMRILERGGYEVKGVDNGNAACLTATNEAYDLVLMDVVMPGISCREAVEHIKNAAPDTRILLSSGYTSGEAVTRLVEQTGLEILRKPYDPDQLLRAVRACLDPAPHPEAKKTARREEDDGNS
jgi:signal transduction histidine kinase/CheY-like chemotaxis protein